VKQIKIKNILKRRNICGSTSKKQKDEKFTMKKNEENKVQFKTIYGNPEMRRGVYGMRGSV
jgi:hypothetical protein